MQCYNCLRLGHAAANCQMQSRCVKCAKSHKADESPLAKDGAAGKSQLVCALCKDVGHTAIFGGCPKLKELKSKAKAAAQKQRSEARYEA